MFNQSFCGEVRRKNMCLGQTGQASRGVQGLLLDAEPIVVSFHTTLMRVWKRFHSPSTFSKLEDLP